MEIETLFGMKYQITDQTEKRENIQSRTVSKQNIPVNNIQ